MILHALTFALLLQDPAAQTRIPVQLGVSVTPDTVTVGQGFVAVIRVRAPRGATIRFPEASDSSANSSPTATSIVGKPVIQPQPDSTGTLASAAYRLAAWDVGPQSLGIGNIVVISGTDTGYVSVAERTVFVRSVLPADSALRVPKPPRPAIVITPFDWNPLLIAALVLAALMLLWRLWIWYRNRQDRQLDPFRAAERDFGRVEAMGLLAAGDAPRHAALMTDVLREYLAARVPGIERSHTSSEMLARSGDIHAPARGLGELLWRTDLIKFANNPVDAAEAERLGASARSIVRAVETMYVERERSREQKAA